jgi:hypothetical protein
MDLSCELKNPGFQEKARVQRKLSNPVSALETGFFISLLVLSRQLILHVRQHLIQRLMQLPGILAARLGQVRPSAAAAADYLGDRFDQVAGLQAALHQVVRDRRNQRRPAIRGAA